MGGLLFSFQEILTCQCIIFMFSYSFADLFLLPRFDILLIVLCNCIESFHIETHIGGIGP